MREASYVECLVSFLAHDLRDGETVLAGASSLLPRMAFRLARLTHAPGLVVWSAFSYLAPGEEGVALGDSATDYLATAPTGPHLGPEITLGDMGRIGDVFYVGGLQVDRHGNTNLWGLKGGEGQLALAGPGPVGTTTMGSFVGRTVITMTRHDPRTFVNACDFVTCIGHRAPDGRSRSELHLPGSGPAWVISPLGIFDFNAESTIRLRFLPPGVSEREVVEATGFPLDTLGVEQVAAPSHDELVILRSLIDDTGHSPGAVMRRPDS